MSQNMFSFPYQAYPEQQQLMHQIYSCLEESGVGCFESPTGTGKTLSTICSTFTWLEEAEKKQIELNSQPALSASVKAAANNGGDDWLQSFVQQYEQSKAPSSASGISSSTTAVRSGDVTLYDRLIERIKSASKQSSRSNMPQKHQEGFMNTFSKPSKPTVRKPQINKPDAVAVDHFPEYFSDQESINNDFWSDDDDDDDEHNNHDRTQVRGLRSKRCDKWYALHLPQILFCSRTHSQLTQFIHEIRKTRFQHVRCVVLGSRRNLCINPAVQALKSDANMNERCLEMMTEQHESRQSVNKTNKSNVDTLANKRQKLKPQSSTSMHANEENSCCFKQQQREHTLALHLLNTPKDIEESLQLGDENHTCPYYASREAIAYAQVICMPYNLLLQAEARQSLGLNLQNRIVIFDEAHNLPEAIYNMYSAELTFDSLTSVSAGLGSYLTHMQSRLGGKNLYYLNLLVLCAKKITALFAPNPRRPALNGSMVLTVNEFLVRVGIDHVNLFKLTRFINTCNIVNRVGGHAANNIHHVSEGNRHEVKHALRAFTALMSCLTRSNADGRVFLHPLPLVAATAEGVAASVATGGESRGATVVIRYHLLDAATVFQEVTNTARSVVLLGGTMQPFSFFISSLLRHVPSERLKVFSCGHIVHPSHVMASVLSSSSLEFTHDKRLALTTTDKLFTAVKMLCETVPRGFVIFFTSYQYMAAVAARWRSDGRLDQLQRLKPLFIETKTTSATSSAEQQISVWDGYCAEIKTGRGHGAVLWSVIGGRLSEGINFSDDLARCVAVIGLPYPDTRDAVLQEKIRHYNEGTTTTAESAGVSLPELLCMRAVNQAIGRAIRHVNDSAAIILIDQRYQQPRIAQQLPGWIRQSLSQPSSMTALQQQLTAFYTSRAQQQLL